MALQIKAHNRASDKRKLNEEGLVVHNDGDAPVNLAGCSITVGKGSGRPRVVTTFKAGIVVQPGETVRLVTGSPGKKSQGEPPEEEGVRNAPLFLKATYLDREGTTVRLMSRQRELCRATV